MNITELHKFISEVEEELPEDQLVRLIRIRDSLDELGPNEWSSKLVEFSNEMLLKDIGNREKLLVLEAEAENTGSIEIKPVYLLLAIIFAALVVYYI